MYSYVYISSEAYKSCLSLCLSLPLAAAPSCRVQPAPSSLSQAASSQQLAVIQPAAACAMRWANYGRDSGRRIGQQRMVARLLAACGDFWLPAVP